ncbi:ABC transporter substrate-binding protein [Burkholderia pseudomultivorans]|uniref:ABC transporter substrate-binding protein n=1 Tax=Burkholderia pseudomultivorans TaxID=1207504 RepID=UPI0001FD854B|nr:ABC transporter substrate-binding protein [Burkholderia pseudomultivorans]EGD03519.1 cationic amino acid ABC transporter, periplasmic binding protein [Burkholderia sp. TJI49]AOI90386.1 ABC transporter substrate-binding protein [Burkholderia pseudomultivorans]KVC33399.1 ABC transporter substrate-binding protein [Burkholderia pseudomultivorans]KVC42854.1 ABC transporter substrate-binding protein [Burkholderia pseudomultivorans]KVC48559.1 ABC transporter substrate-binding protein [Burkholderia
MKRTPMLLIGALLLVAGSAYARDWSTIRFGVDASYPPFESKTADGKLVGFDIDVGNELCRRLNAQCVWVENAFDGMIPGLKARKFDGILSTMSMTPARVKQIAFTSKLFHVPTRLVTRKGANLQPTAESLAGKSIGVEQGSMQETYAKVHWGSKGVNIVSYADQDQVYADLLAGRLDGSLQNAVQAERGFLNTPRGRPYDFAGPALDDKAIFGPGTAIGLSKDNTDLKEKLDAAIAAMIKDGTYARIAKKYFDFDVYGS